MSTIEDRRIQIRKTILEELDASRAAGATVLAVIVSACYRAASPVPSRAEILSEIEWLEAQGLVASLPAALGGRKYMITDAGALARQA